MPWFIDNRQLRAAVWLTVEGIRQPILDRLDQIMGALVTVDSDVLGALTTLSQAVDTEIQAALDAGKLQPGDVSGIQSALTDAKSKLDTAVAAGTATSPSDPTAPATGDAGSTTPPADPGTVTADPSTPATGAGDPSTGATDGTGAPVDPATGQPTA